MTTQQIDLKEYRRAVEMSQMRKLMRYGKKEFEEDWQVAVALAVLMALRDDARFSLMLENCFNRMLAYRQNNPDVLPFEEP